VDGTDPSGPGAEDQTVGGALSGLLVEERMEELCLGRLAALAVQDLVSGPIRKFQSCLLTAAEKRLLAERLCYAEGARRVASIWG